MKLTTLFNFGQMLHDAEAWANNPDTASVGKLHNITDICAFMAEAGYAEDFPVLKMPGLTQSYFKEIKELEQTVGLDVDEQWTGRHWLVLFLAFAEDLQIKEGESNGLQ